MEAYTVPGGHAVTAWQGLGHGRPGTVTLMELGGLARAASFIAGAMPWGRVTPLQLSEEQMQLPHCDRGEQLHFGARGMALVRSEPGLVQHGASAVPLCPGLCGMGRTGLWWCQLVSQTSGSLRPGLQACTFSS